MGLKPSFRLTANSQDITDKLKARLISLRYTDEAGYESDILEITLADNDPDNPIQLPDTGAELELSLGYDEEVERIGLFVVDEIEMAGWPGEMVIRARAAPFEESKNGQATLQSQKSRHWEVDTTIGDMADKIAGEHGLEAAVADAIKSIKLPHTVQADESDMHLLVRIAKKYDAVVKPAGGKLVIAKRGTAKTTSGKQMPAVEIKPEQATSWRVVQSTRETAGMVVAYWRAIKEAKRHEAKVGDGEPVTRLRMTYPTEEMALAAARSELDRRERQKVTLSVTLPGRTGLVAEAPLIMTGFRDGVDGEWSVTRSIHTLDAGGYSTTAEAEIPTDGEEPTSA